MTFDKATNGQTDTKHEMWSTLELKVACEDRWSNAATLAKMEFGKDESEKRVVVVVVFHLNNNNNNEEL